MGEQAGAELTEERASCDDESGLTAGEAIAAGLRTPRGLWGLTWKPNDNVSGTGTPPSGSVSFSPSNLRVLLQISSKKPGFS